MQYLTMPELSNDIHIRCAPTEKDPHDAQVQPLLSKSELNDSATIVDKSEDKVGQRHQRLRKASITVCAILAMIVSIHSIQNRFSHLSSIVTKPKSGLPIIRKIAIVGERNSGTTWMTR